MSIEDWMDRKPAMGNKPLCMEDYPGYNHLVIQCLTCQQEFEGLFRVAPEKIVCPECKVPGVKIIRSIRKIHLQ